MCMDHLVEHSYLNVCLGGTSIYIPVLTYIISPRFCHYASLGII